MDTILETKDLVKRYRNVCAVNNVSLSIHKGDIFGFVGANGAGKTTFMRMVCGLIRPTSGSMKLFGESSEKGLQEKRKNMGALIEHPAVYTNMSALQNLDIQRRYLEMDFGSNPSKALTDLLELVGLADVKDRKAGKFSLGMRQRLGIAIALAGDPDLLVLDEPANGLDPQGIVEIRELLLKLNKERQITVLLCSHILDELSRLATHYGFMDKGRMVKEISAKELEAACKKCVRVEVTNIKALSRVLEAMGMEYQIQSDQEADIFAKVNITKLVLALEKEGGELLSIKEREESLESYYINLMGGGER